MIATFSSVQSVDTETTLSPSLYNSDSGFLAAKLAVSKVFPGFGSNIKIAITKVLQ